MRRLFSLLLTLLVLAALSYLAYPFLKNAARTAELLRAPAPTAGSLTDPLPGRRLANTWGAARSQGRRHEGVDIFAPQGTPVKSATRGVVSRVGDNTLGGRTVTVLGPGGYHHYYAHLSRYADAKVGDWVKPGDVLGFVGNSGNARSTPPHLHYGVYTPAWRALNPYPLLKAD